MFPVDNIREVCRERDITLAELERALSYGNGTIAKWETAKGSPPFDRVVAIAEYLKVPVARLTGEEKKPASNGDELIEILEACKDRSDLRGLFKTAKDLSADDIKKAMAILEALKNV